MARQNVEDEDLIDDRHRDLTVRLGCRFKADGVMLNVRRLAAKYWRNQMGLIPVDNWLGGGYPDVLFELRIAFLQDSNGTRTDFNMLRTDPNTCSKLFVYVDQTREQNAWYFEWKAKKSGAGKKSAKVRREKTGSAQPKKGVAPNEPRTDTEQVFDGVRAAPEQASNSAEPSFSVSVSGEERKNINIRPREDGTNQDSWGEGRKKCAKVWLETVKALGVERDYLHDEEEELFERILEKFGEARALKALEGARYEKPGPGYDPRAHVKLDRIFKNFTSWHDMACNPSLRAGDAAPDAGKPKPEACGNCKAGLIYAFHITSGISEHVRCTCVFGRTRGGNYPTWDKDKHLAKHQAAEVAS